MSEDLTNIEISALQFDNITTTDENGNTVPVNFYWNVSDSAKFADESLSSERTKYIETFKTNNNETYGNQYKGYVQWISDNEAKLKFTDDSENKYKFIADSAISSTSAQKIATTENIGNTSKPIYLNKDGSFKECSNLFNPTIEYDYDDKYNLSEMNFFRKFTETNGVINTLNIKDTDEDELHYSLIQSVADLGVPLNHGEGEIEINRLPEQYVSYGIKGRKVDGKNIIGLYPIHTVMNDSWSVIDIEKIWSETYSTTGGTPTGLRTVHTKRNWFRKDWFIEYFIKCELYITNYSQTDFSVLPLILFEGIDFDSDNSDIRSNFDTHTHVNDNGIITLTISNFFKPDITDDKSHYFDLILQRKSGPQILWSNSNFKGYIKIWQQNTFNAVDPLNS